MKEAGAVISFSPGSELRIGFGLTVLSQCLDAGIPVGASMDTSALTGASSMFAILKLMRDVENAVWESEFKLGARRALEIGTIEGARSMGLDGKIGSLVPGKRADLIMIDPDTLNMGVVTDVAHTVLECTLPENIDTVMVDGRILKRGGKLTAIDPPAVIAEARAALADIRARANWR
jgi:cytosine/adenosine deaminase-related metal-dependent hydrolase